MSLSNFFDKLGWMLQIDSSGSGGFSVDSSGSGDSSSITIQAKGFYHWDGNISPVDLLTTENLNEPAFYGNQITLKAGNTEKTYILDNSGSYFTCNQLISNISDFEKLIRPVHDLINANIELRNIHFYQLKLINPEEDVINHKYTPLWTSG
tara:strand:+ start:3657 stop:4109 length:453 start_codon:yes stop_codon:yes gene_type:complete